MQTIDLEKEKKEILNRYRGLLRACKKSRDDHDKRMIRKAFNVSIEAHKEMRRKSGEPYIYHPIEVARIVADEIGLGTTSVVCALLHDTVEDTDITLDDIERMFDAKTASIVDGLTKISEIIDHSDPNFSLQAKNFRKMLLTLSEDVRVILVKLADRLHNMRTMEFMPRDKQLKIAYETLNIYAPLAHRLGLYSIKTELEDLGLRYTEPELYHDIEDKLASSQKKRQRYINKFSLPIINLISEKGYEFDIKGRTKSVFSIAQKIKSKGVPFEQVYDIFAIRIILNSEPDDEKSDCWRVYSLVTDLYTPQPERLRDWISTPKPNGYESLHTTVMGPDGRWVEVQIRTRRMHDMAERGLAAHWRYKDNGDSQESNLDNWIGKIQEILESPGSNALEFIDDFKLNLFAEEIYVFTPNGDLKNLPNGSTALDFAYEIHSRVGDQCIGAKVNHKLVPLSYKLKSGEQIEIITSNKQVPKQDWLNYVVTAKSKSHIKNALKRDYRKIADEGREKFKSILKKLDQVYDNKLTGEVVKHFHLKNANELYYSIENKVIDKELIKDYFDSREIIKAKKQHDKLIKKHQVKSKTKKNKDVLLIGDDSSKIAYSLATCCHPIPGDEVFGFTTVKDGIRVHKTNCPNAMHLLSHYAYRMIKTQWAGQVKPSFLAGIKFVGIDDYGILSQITTLVSEEEGLNIKSISFDSGEGYFDGKLLLFINDVDMLNNLIEKLTQISGIQKVERLLKIDAKQSN